MLDPLSPLPTNQTVTGLSGFRPLTGLVSARRVPVGSGHPSSFFPESPLTDAQRAGLRYERRVKEKLLLHAVAFGVELGPWFEVLTLPGRRLCQADALLLDPLTVIEVKNHHDTRAYHQLTNLYGPVVEHIYKMAPKLLEITSSFDPAVAWPERDQWKTIFSFDDFYEWLRDPRDRFAIFQWKL